MQILLFMGEERLHDKYYMTSQKNVCVGGYPDLGGDGRGGWGCPLFRFKENPDF